MGCVPSHFSRVRLCENHQTPLSMGFSRQGYWSGLTCPPPGDLLNPVMEPGAPALQSDSLPSEPPGKPITSLARSYWDEVAEWLRRWTANPLCSARVGSNPILVVWLSLWPSAVAQLVKKPPPSLQEPWVQPMCGKGVHSGVLALRIPWTTVHLFTKSGTGLSDFHFT